MRRYAQQAVRICASVLVIVGFAFVLQQVAWRELGRLMSELSAPLLICAAVLNIFNMIFKAGCWRVLLGDSYPVRFATLCRYTIGSFALSAVMPLRAGEAVRVGLLHQQHAVPLTRLVRIVATEKVLDVFAMLLLVSPLPLFAPADNDLGRWLRPLGYLEAGVALVLVLCGIALLLRRGTGRTPLGLHHLFALGSPKQLAWAFGALFCGWCVDWALVLLMLVTVSIPATPWNALWVLLVLNAAIAIPALPGQMGTLELGAASALGLLGVPAEQALAFGLSYHAVQLGPLLVYLLVDGRFLWRQSRPQAAQDASTS